MNKKVHAAAVLAFLSLCLLPQVAPAQLCNAEAYKWVDSHRSELPRSFDEISSFPLNYRRAIYSNLEAGDRAQLWQEQFERALQNQDLTETQRKVLLDAIQLVTPELLRAMKSRRGGAYSQAKRLVVEFEKEAREAFGNSGAGDLFGRIGPADTETGIIRLRDHANLNKELASAVGCSCSDASDYCSSAFNCASGGCTLIRDECGTLWTYDCDGQCQSNSLTPAPN